MAYQMMINLVSQRYNNKYIFSYIVGQFYYHSKPPAGKLPQGAFRLQSAQYPDYSLYWEDTDVYLKVK